MKKTIMLTALIFTFFSCKTTKTAGNQSEKEQEMLLGKISKSDLQKAPYAEWFNMGEESYTAKKEEISALKNHDQNYEIKIFMGTWCDDSKEQVPHFYKILKQINFDLKKTTLIGVDKRKNTPDHLEKGMNITHVPTFIFYKNGKEVNRIVETPAISLENDMLKIISGESYKHNYQD